MSRPTTKEELLNAAQGQYEKMWQLINSISAEEQNATFSSDMATMGKEAHWGRDKNLRDVLVHLYEWHQLLLSWIEDNMGGELRPFLPESYTWKTYGDMNMEFWKKHQNTPYEEAAEMLNTSHKNVISQIESFSDEELFTKKYYPWTGSSSLGSYCISTTSSHYDWAMKKIKNHIKTYRTGK